MAYGVDRYPNPTEADSVPVYYELEDGVLVRRVEPDDEEEGENEADTGVSRKNG